MANGSNSRANPIRVPQIRLNANDRAFRGRYDGRLCVIARFTAQQGAHRTPQTGANVSIPARGACADEWHRLCLKSRVKPATSRAAPSPCNARGVLVHEDHDS